MPIEFIVLGNYFFSGFLVFCWCWYAGEKDKAKNPRRWKNLVGDDSSPIEYATVCAMFYLAFFPLSAALMFRMWREDHNGN